MPNARTTSLITAVGLAALLLLAPGCAGMREGTRAAFNTDMVARAAPPLTGTDWVFPEGDFGVAPEGFEGSWTLVEFFDPG